MRSKGQSQSAFMRLLFSPIRALGKARDMYVRSITNCGNHVGHGYGGHMGAAAFSSLSRSHSAATSSSESSEDFAELVRAASARTLGNRIDVDLVLKYQQQHQQQRKNSTRLPKSSSVGMARIDEDELEGSVGENYPRSRSYAVGKTNVVAF